MLTYEVVLNFSHHRNRVFEVLVPEHVYAAGVVS
jgi:hypothetical protein